MFSIVVFHHNVTPRTNGRSCTVRPGHYLVGYLVGDLGLFLCLSNLSGLLWFCAQLPSKEAEALEGSGWPFLEVFCALFAALPKFASLVESNQPIRGRGQIGGGEGWRRVVPATQIGVVREWLSLFNFRLSRSSRSWLWGKRTRRENSLKLSSDICAPGSA